MPRLRLSLALLCCLLPHGVFAAEKIRVVASFSILGDIVKEVGGERIELTTLVGPGASVHSYEPTPAAIKAVGNADLVIVNGISYESWMGRLVVSSGYSGQVVVAAKDITPLSVNDKLDMDPHAWHSVSNVKVYVASIRDALIEMDRRNSARYKENADRYTQHLDTLERWIKTEIAQVPDDKRVIVTAHNAFQYFGRYYGVRILSASGPTPDSSPSAADLAKLTDQMRRDQVRAIFLETMTDDSIAKQLQQDTGAILVGTLYADSLSGANGPAPTYIAMMRYNVSKLVEGMQQNGTISANATATMRIPDDATVISIP